MKLKSFLLDSMWACFRNVVKVRGGSPVCHKQKAACSQKEGRQRMGTGQGNVRGTSAVTADAAAAGDSRTARPAVPDVISFLRSFLSSCFKGRDKKLDQKSDISSAFSGWFILWCLREFCVLYGFV